MAKRWKLIVLAIANITLAALHSDVTAQKMTVMYPNQISRWNQQFIDGVEDAFSSGNQSDSTEAKVKELFNKINGLPAENNPLVGRAQDVNPAMNFATYSRDLSYYAGSDRH